MPNSEQEVDNFTRKKMHFNPTVAKEMVFNIQNNLQYKLNSYNCQ